MNKTNDFKYNLPAYSDPVDIEDLNDNFRGIDDALMAGLCKKDYTGNNMGSSDPSARKYAWAPWLEIVNDNEFDVVVTDRNAPVESEEATINVAAGQTFRKYINGRYYMNFYVQDQHDVTFKWFTNAETYINESGGGGGGTGTVTSVSVQGGNGSHLTGSGNPIETSGTITINVDEGYSIPSDNEQTAWDGKAADLKAEIDSSTYVLTLQLKDSSGNLIGNERTIDLPLETMVVDGEYDSQTQKIKLELKNGNYVEFSVADLVSGLQTELNDTDNKLDPDYIDYDADHRAVSDTEKNTWSGKQNALTFDDTPTQNSNNPVKSGGIYIALAGKQASLDQTQLAAVNSGIDSTKVAQISTNQSNILYGIKTGAKNQLKLTGSVWNPNMLNVYWDYENGTIRVTGSIATTDTVFIDLGTWTAPEDGTYRIYANSEACTANIRVYDDSTWSTYTVGYSNEATWTKGTTKNIYLRIAKGAVVGDVTVTPMICPKSIFDADPTFAPFALPNYDLTRLEAKDRAGLIECVDGGAKNILAPTDLVPYGDGLTNNPNLTCTNNGDGTYTLNGSTVGNGRIIIHHGITSAVYGGKMLSGCPNINTSSEKCRLSIYTDTGASGVCHDAGQGNEIPTSFNASHLAIYVFSGNTFNNVKFYPMICTKAAFGVSQKFVPYCKSNSDLTEYSIAKKLNTSSVVTMNTDYTLQSETTLFLQGNHLFGNLIVKKNTGNFGTSEMNIGSFLSGYRPVGYESVRFSTFNTSQWGVSGFGYGYVNPTSGNIVVKTAPVSVDAYNYVNVFIDMVIA